MKKIQYKIVYFLLIVLSIGCTSIKSEFNNAKTENTISSYEKFIKNYPDSNFTNKAQVLLENAIFEQTKSKDTVEAYDKYINKYPSGKFIKIIKELREESLYKALVKRDIYGYFDKYESIYPSGSYISNAKHLINEYISSYPSGKYISKVKKLKEDLTYKIAKFQYTIESYDSYLNNYPDGKYFTEVKMLKEELKQFINSIPKDLYKAIAFLDILKNKRKRAYCKPKGKYETTKKYESRKEKHKTSLYIQDRIIELVVDHIYKIKYTFRPDELKFSYNADAKQIDNLFVPVLIRYEKEGTKLLKKNSKSGDCSNFRTCNFRHELIESPNVQLFFLENEISTKVEVISDNCHGGKCTGYIIKKPFYLNIDHAKALEKNPKVEITLEILRFKVSSFSKIYITFSCEKIIIK